MSHPISKPRKPEILISGGLAVGGPQTHVTILCKCLLAAGANVTIAAAATNMKPHEISAVRALGVRVIVPKFGFGRMKFLGTLQTFLTWPLLLPRSFDTLYCIGHGKMHLFCLRFLRDGGKAIYHEIVECPKPGSTADAVAARMTAIIGNSRKVSSDLRALFPNTPVTTIPFLTSEVEIPPPERKPMEPGETIRIAFLGRMVSHKRPDKLIEEWQKLCMLPAFGPARLDLYGGDYGNGLIDRLRATISCLGLGEQITVHGRYDLDALPEIFSRADLVVLPSEYEGLPLVLVEAMQQGIPIVATSAGGCEELGDANPDVCITQGTQWEDFVPGLATMIQRLRNGEINPDRLHAWTEKRYGFQPVSEAWIEVLTENTSVSTHK
ncbi:MAG: glycosyltransferase family 4 protein [Verrucomicrobiota bacterium]